ncbi:MinD/ParA family ATP-binding protein [Mycolicibacterium aromaticivorans]|nr:MinD/ParA family protein [Mycolicibacterium aromaticivorans]
MTESSNENDFYSQYVGEGSSPTPPPWHSEAADEDAPATSSPLDPLGGPPPPATSTSPSLEPPSYTPPPPATETVAPLDSEGHTQIVDRDQMRREMEALRNADSPRSAEPAAPEETTTAYYGAPAPRVWDRATQDPEGGRHNAPPPPQRNFSAPPPPAAPYGPPPQEGLFGGPQAGIPRQAAPPPPGYRPPAGDDGRHVARVENDPFASVGAMRAQIHEGQVAAPYKPVPETGWRHGVYKMTRINLGLSAKEAHWNDLRRRLKVNLRGKYVIAVMQSKGGVNKTSTTVLLGAALSKYRDEKIVAIDANPANGNLARRIDEPSTMSWRGLNSDRNLRDYSDFREYLGKDNHSGLEVLGSDKGRTPMTGADLITAWSKLQVQYPIAIVDCGNQLDDDLTHALLEHIRVDAIVVPSTTRLDGAQGAADTLNWLLESGYPHLVREAVVIVSNINKVNASAQVKQLHADFERTVRSVHTVDFDPHLSDAVPIEFDRLQPETALRYIEAAASLADGFARATDRDPGARQQRITGVPEGQPRPPQGGGYPGAWPAANNSQGWSPRP